MSLIFFRGKAGHGAAGLSEARQGRAWHGLAGHSLARQGAEGRGDAWQGKGI